MIRCQHKTVHTRPTHGHTGTVQCLEMGESSTISPHTTRTASHKKPVIQRKTNAEIERNILQICMSKQRHSRTTEVQPRK